MKTIVAATGFSTTSDNAASYAGALAQQLNARLVLFHVYTIPVTLGEMPQVFIPVEEMKESSDQGLQRVKTELLRTNAAVIIDIESRLGDLNTELNAWCDEHNPDLVIIGNHHPEGLERMLLGDNTVDLIRHINKPVLAVPPGFPFQPIKDIAIAIDEDCTSEIIGRAKTLAEDLDAAIRFMHVQTKDKEEDLSFLLGEQDRNNLEVVQNESLTDGIKSFIQQRNVQLLIIFPHQHSKLARLFTKTSTDELTHSIDIPIVSITQTRG